MLLGYHTNGMAHHEPFDAIRLLAEIGYRSVAITIDHGALWPRAASDDGQLNELGSLLHELRMRTVIETGARFLLDPRQKHEPTLITADDDGRQRRIEFYRHAVDCAAALGSDCVSLWSGVRRSEASRQQCLDWLVAGLREVLHYAARRDVSIGFEPEPGMLVDSMAAFEELAERVDMPNFRLTLDVGHLHCTGEVPIAEVIRRFGHQLVNVHIEDMNAGVHEHLMFGEGQIDFPPVLAALAEVSYTGGVHVELSRHSHQAPEAARRAFDFLQPTID